MSLAVFMACSSAAHAWDLFQEDEDEEERQEFCTSGQGNFTYLKMGGGLVSIGSNISSGPSLSLGRRFERGAMAIDISLNGTFWGRSTYYATPKMLYLHYFDHQQPACFYAGGGLSYGGVVSKDSHRPFHGILAEGALGYEWNRHTTIRTFVELDISQGILPISSRHSIMAPGIAFTCGVGF